MLLWPTLLYGEFLEHALIDKVTPDPPYTVCNTVYGHPQTKAQQAHAKQQRVDLDAAYIFGLDGFRNDTCPFDQLHGYKQ
jgi:hypothetical protein